MSRNFGNPLVNNRKGHVSEQSARSAGQLAKALEELNEQAITLCREDIQADAPGAPPLDWTTFERGEIGILLKDTEGLAEGSVTIKASTLQRLHPALLRIELEKEYRFPISLKTVVLQLQPHLLNSSEESQDCIGPDFDTPIAQVAREDEGFFKLAKLAEPKETSKNEMTQVKPKIPVPVLTPADRPASPPMRRKNSPQEAAKGSSLPPSGMTASTEKTCREVVSEHGKVPGWKVGAAPWNASAQSGSERLKEIFMTEDLLDAREVAFLLGAFPKVNWALILLGDGTILGGSLPESYDLETVRQAPSIMRTVREYNRRLSSNETPAFTLLGDRPLSLFAEGSIHVLISHEGRGLLPGVRERIGEVARALNLLCEGAA
jgi:hypothetical protein